MGYFRMRRDLRAPIAPAPFADGVVLADVTIELARECRELMNRAYAEAGYAPVSFDDWYPELVADSEYAPALLWAAMAGGRVVGFCQCWRVPFVKDLVVDRAWRRQGLGAALLTQALETFVARGAVSIDLKTDTGNEKAQSLYRRLGFVIVERVD